VNPTAALSRRNLVLEDMYKQGVLTRADYQENLSKSLPASSDIKPPHEDSKAPYFTSWMRQQLVDRYGAGRAFGGGLRVYSTLDLDLQQIAERAVAGRLAGVGPSSAVVVLDNSSGGVRAMVGGPDFQKRPFNLATSGHRQPGSAFKPFTLVRALEAGRSPSQLFTSKKKIFRVPGSRTERFVVNNYENQYSGVTTLTDATVRSDNSVYAELGLSLGKTPTQSLRGIAKLAQEMGIETRVSTNPAMTLGGLKAGVTPLEIAHAYETLAASGRRISGTFAPQPGEPVAVSRVFDPKGRPIGRNEPRRRRVVPSGVANSATAILQQVVGRGTGKRAAYGDFAAGKTGTTENYGDAWFVGFTKTLTIAVWVGYADSNKSMLTEYHGQPVAGGTYPAEIWHDIVLSWQRVVRLRLADRRAKIAARQAEKAAAEAAKRAATTPVQQAPAPVPQQQLPPQNPAPQQKQPVAPVQGRTTPAPKGGRTGAAPGTGGGPATPDPTGQ